jgi:hypothetical protein
MRATQNETDPRLRGQLLIRIDRCITKAEHIKRALSTHEGKVDNRPGCHEEKLSAPDPTPLQKAITFSERAVEADGKGNFADAFGFYQQVILSHFGASLVVFCYSS